VISGFRIAIVALALVTGLAGTVAAGQFEHGVEALRRGDTATAARLLDRSLKEVTAEIVIDLVVASPPDVARTPPANAKVYCFQNTTTIE
jgi:hypothetical protein